MSGSACSAFYSWLSPFMPYRNLFSGRGAYIQIGSMLGTIMVANVLMVIIPGQRELVQAKLRRRRAGPDTGSQGQTAFRA